MRDTAIMVCATFFIAMTGGLMLGAWAGREQARNEIDLEALQLPLDPDVACHVWGILKGVDYKQNLIRRTEAYAAEWEKLADEIREGQGVPIGQGL